MKKEKKCLRLLFEAVKTKTTSITKKKLSLKVSNQSAFDILSFEMIILNQDNWVF